MRKSVFCPPNLKIMWRFEEGFCFTFDLDEGEYRYDYYPEDGHWDTRADSRDYARADAFRLHTDSMTDYLEDQARYIMERFTQVLNTEFKYGFVDTCELGEVSGYVTR